MINCNARSLEKFDKLVLDYIVKINEVEDIKNYKNRKINFQNESENRIREKLLFLKNIQKSEKIRINSGGQIFEVLKSDLLECNYNNILNQKLNTTDDKIEEIFLDINPKIFESVLLILLKYKKELNYGTTNTIIKLNLPECVLEYIDKEQIIDYLNEFFLFNKNLIFE